jgi:hypothetical protein
MEPVTSSSADPNPRSVSALSHHRTQSAFSTCSSVHSRAGRALVQQPEGPIIPLKPSEVVPTATYMERGLRWMEKEEAVSLREAMEDMTLEKPDEDDIRIQAAAQNEASELVWQHQHPEAAPQPGAPYRYREHLRKNSYQHARTRSVGRYGGIGMPTGLARDIPRSISGGSSSSGGMHSERSRMSSGSSNFSWLERNISSEPPVRRSIDSARDVTSTSSIQKPYGSITSVNRPQGIARRTSAKRNISGEIIGSFTGEQIWEEPELEPLESGLPHDSQDIPAPLRIKNRNPLNRVQFAQDVDRSDSTPGEPARKYSRIEIHRNPPSQSRNPVYTANLPPVVQTADVQPPDVGLEIRSDDIRQATSMRLKDRSPKLPIPTAVSDRPGRPIVSFDANWKPKEADVKPEVRARPGNGPSDRQRWSIPNRSDSADVSTPIPTIHLPDTPSIQVNDVPTISIPSINLPDSAPTVPKINFPDAPKISVSAPVAPTINIEPSNTNSDSKRPLPDPKTAASRPPPRHYATAPNPGSHWTLVGKRATAACHQCQLPIEGRVVGLRGATEKFHPGCFICFTCGTGLEALEVFEEPSGMRSQRLDRIERRALGDPIPEIEGQTIADDGDPRLRYFCHLDWHEIYAPKCKHCKTPILGEHTIALGEHWHFGHFFCAECGDPFERGMSHIEKDGYAWCINCQTKRTERRAPKCMKCRLPVIGMVVQALGGEWHDKCFRCITCKGDFPDGSFFPRQVGNETAVTCTKCMEVELKA